MLKLANRFRSVAQTFCIFSLATVAQAQVVDSTVVLKSQIYTQEPTSGPAYAASIVSAGFALRDPLAVSPLSGSTVLFPNGLQFQLPYALGFDSRGELDFFAPSGRYTFDVATMPRFTATATLTGDLYPPPPTILNLEALQNVAVDGPLAISWSGQAGFPKSDFVVLTILSVPGAEEIFSTPDIDEPDALDGSSVGAAVPIPPGKEMRGVLTVVRPVDVVTDPQGSSAIAAYGASVYFTVKSTAPPETTVPTLVSRTPAPGDFGVDPTTELEFQFNEPMLRSGSLTASVSSVDMSRMTMKWSADQRSVRVRPPGNLPAGPVTFAFGNVWAAREFSDLSGNKIPKNMEATSFFVGRFPVFTQPMLARTDVGAGTTARLSAGVMWPGPNLSLQWLRDGVVLPGATKATLEIPNLQPADGGLFELVASNDFGTVTSPPTLLLADTTDLRPRFVTLTPEGEVVLAPGRSIDLRAFSSAAGSTYQWRRNGVPLSGKTGTVLTLSNVTPAENAVYDVVASTPYGSMASSACELTVSTDALLPKDVIGPFTHPVVLGTNTSVVGYFGALPLNLLLWWEFNGARMTGVADTVLTIENMSAARAGVYRCIVSNGRDQIVTATHILTLVLDARIPRFTQLPSKDFINEDSGASIYKPVEGTAPLTYQWRKDGIDVPGAMSLILAIPNGDPAQAGTYTLVASNAYGSTESPPTTIVFLPRHVAPGKPRITTPGPLYVSPGATLGLDYSWDGLPRLPSQAQWRRDGLPIPGWTNDFLQVQNFSSANDGNYTVVLQNQYGSTESDPLVVRTLRGDQLPVITVERKDLTVVPGARIALRAGLASAGTTTTRWFLNGKEIKGYRMIGMPGTEFEIPSAQLDHGGIYSFEAANAAGSVTAEVAAVTIGGIPEVSSAHLLNVSTRAFAGEGSATAIAGFAVDGVGSKRLLIRGIASQLRKSFNLDAAGDARLTVFHGNDAVASSDDWTHQPGVAALASAQLGASAFNLDPAGDDAALLFDAAPGTYTVHLQRDPSKPGIGMVEVYDLDAGYSTSRITNLSSRVFVGTGSSIAIPGIVVSAGAAKTYLVRAIGPGLAAFHVDGFLADPKLALNAVNLGTFAENDDWENQINPVAVVAATARSNAFALAAGSRDSSMLVMLSAGSYTVLVSGADGGTGIALLEIYEVPAP